MSEIHLRESKSLPKTKPHPKLQTVQFFYSASDDGTDENLLILLHGLGDTHVPFSKLGKNLKLPQTAILSVRAPEQIPFLYEDAYQWYPSFDELGEIIERPNPTTALCFLGKLIDHLTNDCQWPIDHIHFLGFAQGGSVATEFVLERWKARLILQSSQCKDDTNVLVAQSFASIISISGPLLSYPTISEPCPTPVFVTHRPPLHSSPVAIFKRAFSSVTESRMNITNEGMPASREEWEPIMRFWSERLRRRPVDGLHEMMTGPDRHG